MEEIPSQFDLIVVGTGMPECIIAAAASRIGKKVLHLDRNAYYGSGWASFSYDKFMEFINETKNYNENRIENSSTTFATDFLVDGEVAYSCPTISKSITNISFIPFIGESEMRNTFQSNGDKIHVNEESTPYQDQLGTENVESTSYSHSIDSSASKAINTPCPWTLNAFLENRRKFNIDLAPKLMFATGSIVKLLISSNTARYAEFQCINRVLTYIKGRIEQVPTSRADVFSTKNVSVVEKRMLMKFLTFCLNFEEQMEEIQGFEHKLYVDFLRSKKLTPIIEHYIIHGIAMVDKNCNTIQGLLATKKFLESLGKYGKTPFLFTCYGSAELPQCFCRLCAVYEGTYCLKRQPESVICKDGKLCGIMSMNQRFDCQWLVLESGYAPPNMLSANDAIQKISRAILITDSSVFPSVQTESTIMQFPPCNGTDHAVTFIELTSKNYVCPEDLYLVYLFCQSSKSTAEMDLKHVVESLYNTSNCENEVRPNILWSVYYNQKCTSSVDLNAQIPAGMYLTSPPDSTLDYEYAVKEAESIFSAMFPNEEFLPRAPDPEDIIIESGNPGDDVDISKIENDVQGKNV